MAAATHRAKVWLMIACMCLGRTVAKLHTGVVRLGPPNSSIAGTSPWQFVGKFGYGIGMSSYDVRVRLLDAANGPKVNLALEAFLDEEWDQVAHKQPCDRATVARERMDLEVSGEWSAWSSGYVYQSVRPHIWYFAISRCRGVGDSSIFAQNGTAPLAAEYELSTRQDGGSELGVEVLHMPAAVTLAVACLSALLVHLAVRCRKFRASTGALHPVIWALAATVMLQWSSQVFHLMHLLAFETRGMTESGVGALADISFMLSQVVCSALFLVISQGYTLDRSKESLLERARPVVAIIALVHVLLVGHSIREGDHADRHHDNGGLVGWTLVLVRLMLYCWFMLGMHSLQRASELRLKPFLNRFMVVGSLYFLSYPVIYSMVQLFAAYLQHPLLEICMTVMQTASALWLSDLFLTRGYYYNVSTLSASLLPGGCSPFSSPSRRKRD